MKLEYEIVYAVRRTIGIVVERDGRVIVRAPTEATPEAVSLAVERKRAWIWDKLQDPRKYPERRYTKEFVSGEGFLYLGRNYPLLLVDDHRGEVRLEGGHFELHRDEKETARELFEHWYSAQAQEHLKPRVESVARAMGVEFNRVTVRDLRYRWASCSAHGALSFSWRVAQAPTVVVDYLIAHELAHLIEPDHSPAFWNVVAVQAPAWEKAREWLRDYGEQLDW